MLIIQQGTQVAIRIFILIVVLFNTLTSSDTPFRTLLVDSQQ